MHFRIDGKGGKIRYIPVGLKAQRLIDEYLEVAGNRDQLKGPLFRPVKNNVTKTLAKRCIPSRSMMRW